MFIFNEAPRHKVFLSFHHTNEVEVREFERRFHDAETFVSRSVADGDIDPNLKTDTTRRLIRDKFISDSTVTIVLIGNETWQRKHVDWEIGYSITQTTQNTRCGLIGILLPSYRSCQSLLCQRAITVDGHSYTPCNIPPRLNDNILNGYAKIYGYPWSENQLKEIIHRVFIDRSKILPNNSRTYYSNNRSGAHWIN